MPSPAALALTQRHRLRLRQLAATVQQRIRSVSSTATLDDIDAWWERVEPGAAELVRRGANAAAELTERYLREHGRVEGRQVRPERATPNREEIATSLLVTGPVAFKTNMADTGDAFTARSVMATMLEGAAQRLALNGGRRTVMGTFATSQAIAGWRRRTSGSPCHFCAMLAGRGAVYSRGSVDFQAHDHDNCFPEPLYEREQEPEDVQRLQQQWNEVTAGRGGDDAIRAWREFWTAETTT